MRYPSPRARLLGPVLLLMTAGVSPARALGNECYTLPLITWTTMENMSDASRSRQATYRFPPGEVLRILRSRKEVRADGRPTWDTAASRASLPSVPGARLDWETIVHERRSRGFHATADHVFSLEGNRDQADLLGVANWTSFQAFEGRYTEVLATSGLGVVARVEGGGIRLLNPGRSTLDLTTVIPSLRVAGPIPRVLASDGALLFATTGKTWVRVRFEGGKLAVGELSLRTRNGRWPKGLEAIGSPELPYGLNAKGLYEFGRRLRRVASASEFVALDFERPDRWFADRSTGRLFALGLDGLYTYDRDERDLYKVAELPGELDAIDHVTARGGILFASIRDRGALTLDLRCEEGDEALADLGARYRFGKLHEGD